MLVCHCYDHQSWWPPNCSIAMSEGTCLLHHSGVRICFLTYVSAYIRHDYDTVCSAMLVVYIVVVIWVSKKCITWRRCSDMIWSWGHIGVFNFYFHAKCMRRFWLNLCGWLRYNVPIPQPVPSIMKRPAAAKKPAAKANHVTKKPAAVAKMAETTKLAEESSCKDNVSSQSSAAKPPIPHRQCFVCREEFAKDQMVATYWGTPDVDPFFHCMDCWRKYHGSRPLGPLVVLPRQV